MRTFKFYPTLVVFFIIFELLSVPAPAQAAPSQRQAASTDSKVVAENPLLFTGPIVTGLPFAPGETWYFTQNFHGGVNALDFQTVTGSAGTVRAADSGTVTSASETCIIIDRGDGISLGYQHVNPNDIAKFHAGMHVNKGDVIGSTTTIAGCGGNTRGAVGVLHFWAQGAANFQSGSVVGGFTIGGICQTQPALNKDGVKYCPITRITYTVSQPPAACTPGNQVDAAFWGDVLTNLNTQTEATINDRDFATRAFTIWSRYENTRACYNPLATTWGRPGATNFNSVGVKNYATRDDGVAATANTIGTRNSATSYSAIRAFLAHQSFDEAGLTANLSKYSGSGGYVANLVNEWKAMFGTTGPETVVREQIFWDNTYSGTVSASRIEQWPIQFNEARSFALSVTRTSGDASLRLILLNTSKTEITHIDGADSVTLRGQQPAGGYFAQVQALSGSGAYTITIKQEQTAAQPSASLTCPANASLNTPVVCSLHLDPAGTALIGADITLNGFGGALELTGVENGELIAGSDAITLDKGSANERHLVWAGANGKSITQAGELYRVTLTGKTAGSVTVGGTGKAIDANSAEKALTFQGATIQITDIQPPDTSTTLTGAVRLAGNASSNRAKASLHSAAGNEIASVQVAADGSYTLQAAPGSYTLRIQADGYLLAEKPVTLVQNTPFAAGSVTLLAGDLNADAKVDALDVISLGSVYGITPVALQAADLNSDGQVNLFDLILLAANWRKTGPTAW